MRRTKKTPMIEAMMPALATYTGRKSSLLETMPAFGMAAVAQTAAMAMEAMIDSM